MTDEASVTVRSSTLEYFIPADMPMPVIIVSESSPWLSDPPLLNTTSVSVLIDSSPGKS